jgi:hypothetical protein
VDRQFIRDKLIEVLVKIQTDSGYAPVAIDEATCPLDDLEGFDSQLWPISIRLLVKALGAEIPRRMNIYVSLDGKSKLTLRETIDIVFALVNQNGGRYGGRRPEACNHRVAHT